MHLTDCFMDLIVYVTYFLKTAAVKQPAFEQVRADVLRLLSQSESSLKQGVFSQEDYDLARFAVCTWVDEALLGSSWNFKGQWQREQLQRLYYQTTEGGEEFFEKLNDLGLHQQYVREVYYLCLALGFMGRYCHKGDEVLLDQLKISNLKLLLGSSVGLPSLERTELFPEAHPTEWAESGPQRPRFRFSIFSLAALGAPVVLFGLLYLMEWFALSGIGENFLRTVP
jgi:type VI secretion system protein ImpK